MVDGEPLLPYNGREGSSRSTFIIEWGADELVNEPIVQGLVITWEVIDGDPPNFIEQYTNINLGKVLEESKECKQGLKK